MCSKRSHVQLRFFSVMCAYSFVKLTSSLTRVPFYLKRSNSCNKIISNWISDMKSTGSRSPNITVSPRSSLMDRKVKICISGLEAGQPITLHASVVGDAYEIFESHAHYVANKEGKWFVTASQFLACMWRHHFLRSKTNEPPKFLSSSGIRMGKLTFVYNFSAQ